MKVMVVGKGGREHALVRALRLSESVLEVHVAPGNAGMAKEAKCHQLGSNSSDSLLSLVKKNQIDLVVIGPEGELVDGWADDLRAADVFAVGPSKKAAQLEGSKIFAKEFMISAKVPTAAYEVVSSVSETLSAATRFSPPYILKADGLAAGKGVFICKTIEELQESSELLFEKKILGTAGERALLEEFQPGWELSFLVFTDGEKYQSLPLAQDHKRLKDNDDGPNTGGMGVVAPIKISEELLQQVEQKIIKPSIDELKKQEMLYRGVLYVGLMITPNGPSVLEYNVRFGDPEAQVILPLLDGDWGECFLSLAQGQLAELKWKPLYSACVVMAAEGYPDAPKKGVVMSGNATSSSASSYFLHAGTALNREGQWVTNGGRVLNAVGLGSTMDEALQKAYHLAESVQWPGLQMRKDIGRKALEDLNKDPG